MRYAVLFGLLVALAGEYFWANATEPYLGLLRVWRWDSVPPGLPPDEPWHVINARAILEAGKSAMLFDVPQWRHPNVHHFLAAGLLLLVGDPRLALVLLGAIPGAIAVGLLY